MLDILDNSQLALVEPGQFSNDELMAEQERCQEVIDLNIMSGDDLSYWFDRVARLEQLRKEA